MRRSVKVAIFGSPATESKLTKPSKLVFRDRVKEL